MNAFDVRAVAWVLTRDVFADTVRAALGASRRIRPGALTALVPQWNALEDAQRKERQSRRGSMSPGARVAPGARLPTASANALDAVVQRMAAECPEWYGAAALWRRWRTSLLQASIGSSSALILAVGSSSESPLADVALVMLVMSMWCLLTTLQLWRIYRLVKRLSEPQTPHEGNALALEAKENPMPRGPRS